MTTFTTGSARANAATELRLAGSLRRDAAAGKLPRAAATSAIRDCLRHARYCRVLAGLTLLRPANNTPAPPTPAAPALPVPPACLIEAAA